MAVPRIALPRRLLAIALLVACALTAFPAALPAPVVAAGTPSRRGSGATPCRFTKTATVWTLRADCATRHTIALPHGVTLDGAGKTITLNGSARSYAVGGSSRQDRAGLLIADGVGGVRHVALRQHLQGRCRGSNSVWAIAFANASGRVADTTITAVGVAPGQADNCYDGIFAGGDFDAPQQVDLAGVKITGPDRLPDPSSVTQRAIAIEFMWAGTGTVADSVIQDTGTGVRVSDSATVTVTDSTIQDVWRGGDVWEEGVLTLRDNTLSVGGTGIFFNENGGGAASGNAISGFTCGIGIHDAADAVTIGTNTFPSPGNQFDVCDSRG